MSRHNQTLQTQDNGNTKRKSDAAAAAAAAAGDAGDVEPKAKRVALNDISNTFSNVLLDSTKKPLDKKPFDQKARLCVKADSSLEYDFDKECGKDTVQ
uniref:Uncharacterized protein n=1 Tax=Panagrolaimus sp. PS1159 TaxID=55785 RepID=A0AC35G0J5_9BILA